MFRLKSVLLVSLASVASAALLFGCSGDDDSDTSSNGSNGGDAIVTGSAKCDQASMQKAVESWAKANGGVEGDPADQPQELPLRRRLAVAFPNVGSGEGEITVTAVFEAEGQFWIPKDRSEVCGNNAGPVRGLRPFTRTPAKPTETRRSGPGEGNFGADRPLKGMFSPARGILRQVAIGHEG